MCCCCYLFSVRHDVHSGEVLLVVDAYYMRYFVVFSPSGCTFWGKKPWSRKKKILWQLGTLVGAPVGISLVAGIAVPAMIIGIPVWVGRKVSKKYCKCNVYEELFFSILPNGFKMVKFKMVWCGIHVPAGKN